MSGSSTLLNGLGYGKQPPYVFALACSARATCIAALVVGQGDSLHSAASNTTETLYLALIRWLHIDTSLTKFATRKNLVHQ
jgi:hypothetical protein